MGARQATATVDDLLPEPVPPSPISAIARRHITANGRRLYVWEQRRRRWWLLTTKTRIRAAMERPDRVTFNPPTRMDGIDVHLDRRAELWFAGHPYAVVDLTRRRLRFAIADEDSG